MPPPSGRLLARARPARRRARRARVRARGPSSRGTGLAIDSSRPSAPPPWSACATVVKPKRHVHQRHQAAEQQAGPDQQHQRDRDLGEHQAGARDVTLRRRRSRRGCCPSACSAVPGFEACQAGTTPNSTPGDHRQRQRQTPGPGHRREMGATRGTSPGSSARIRSTPQNAEQHARAPPPTSAISTLSVSSWRISVDAVGADRRANGQLARADGGARHQQVRDVGHHDQQHASHGAEQHQQRRARRADQLRPAAALRHANEV